MTDAPPAHTHHALPRTASGRFVRGMGLAVSGPAFVLRHPSTWPLLVVPTLITTASFVGALFIAWKGVPWLLSEIWWPGNHPHWAVAWVWVILMFLLRAAAFLVSGLMLYFGAGIVAVPFNDRLSEKVERLTLGEPPAPFTWRQRIGAIVASVTHSALSVTLYALVMISLFVLEILPLAGSGLHLGLGAFATSLFLARETMDGCMSRRRLSYRRKLRVLRTNLAIVLGFGLTASLFMAVPLMNFVMLPLLIAGGTRLFCELERAGRVPEARA